MREQHILALAVLFAVFVFGGIRADNEDRPRYKWQELSPKERVTRVWLWVWRIFLCAMAAAGAGWVLYWLFDLVLLFWRGHGG